MTRRLHPVFLAAVLVVFGLYSIIHPTEAFVPHPGSGRYQSIIGHDPPSERVTKKSARFYGPSFVGIRSRPRMAGALSFAQVRLDMTLSPNQPASGNARFALQFDIERPCPGMPEPEC